MSIRKGISIIAGNGGSGSGSANLLDFKWADHLLNDVSWLRADTFSWQDGNVYSAVYQHLVADMLTATERSIYDYSNVSLVGDLINNKGILSGFTSNTSYATLPTITAPTTSFEFVIKVHTPNTFTAQGDIVNCSEIYKGMIIRVSTAGAISWWMSSNGTSYNIVESGSTGLTLSVNTDYFIKLTWNGSQYVLGYSTDGETYTSGNVISNANPLNLSSLIQLGGGRNSNPWLSTIDIRNAYIKVDDVEVWHGINTHSEYVATDGHVFVDESIALNKYIETGVAWYYVLDAVNTRFKLPRTKFGFTGIRDGVGAPVQERATQMYLYFYVGNYTHSAIEQTAGLNAELFNGKADVNMVAHVVIEFQEPTAENNYTWYRKYADGWCEQGQKHATVSPVTYPITMADTNYTLSSVPHYSADSVTYWSDYGYNKTTTGFSFRIPQYGIDYVVYGMYAQE